uniref:Uncharacterized protein n=1 Tax=Meloidogyne enterolobii TaxID=390850 RepID=A0A6V7TI61_MELEN|nr:unnamed protein product [Meloidogyne enterolobii]
MIYLKFYGILFLLFLICFENSEGYIEDKASESKQKTFKAVLASPSSPPSSPQLSEEGSRLVKDSDGDEQSLQPNKLENYIVWKSGPTAAPLEKKNATNSGNTSNSSKNGPYVLPHPRNNQNRNVIDEHKKMKWIQKEKIGNISSDSLSTNDDNGSNQLSKQTKERKLPIIMYGLSSDAEEYVPARSKFMSEQKIPPTISHHENEDNKNATAKTSKIWDPKNTLEQNMEEVVPIIPNLNDQESDQNNIGRLPIVQLFKSNFALGPILSKKKTGDSFFSPQHPVNSSISPVDHNMQLPTNHQNLEFNRNQILPNHSQQNVNVPSYNEGYTMPLQHGYNNRHHTHQTVRNTQVRYNMRTPLNLK